LLARLLFAVRLYADAAAGHALPPTALFTAEGAAYYLASPRMPTVENAMPEIPITPLTETIEYAYPVAILAATRAAA